MITRSEYERKITNLTCDFLNKEIKMSDYISILLEYAETSSLSALHVGSLIGLQIRNFDLDLYHRVLDTFWDMAND